MYKSPRTAEEKARIQSLKAKNARRRAEKSAKQRLPEYYNNVANKEESVPEGKASSGSSDDSYDDFDSDSYEDDYEDSDSDQ